MLISSLKLKRPPTVKVYRQLLDKLYEQALEEESAPRAKL
jgi:long-chain acyl-CoA synthetase